MAGERKRGAKGEEGEKWVKSEEEKRRENKKR